jgi:hypothetical protein
MSSKKTAPGKANMIVALPGALDSSSLYTHDCVNIATGLAR